MIRIKRQAKKKQKKNKKTVCPKDVESKEVRFSETFHKGDSETVFLMSCLVSCTHTSIYTWIYSENGYFFLSFFRVDPLPKGSKVFYEVITLEMCIRSPKMHLFYFRDQYFITKTCLYTFDPLKPHFNIVKLEFTGIYVIALIFAQKNPIDCGYSLEPHRRGCSNEYNNLCFEQKYEKISAFFI